MKIYWLVIFLCAVMCIATQSVGAMLVSLMLILFIPLTALINLYVAKRLCCKINAPDTADKSRDISAEIIVENKSFLPACFACVCGQISNSLTGESEKIRLCFSALARNNVKLKCQLSSVCCGVLVININCVRLFDISRIIRKSAMINKKSKIILLPEIHCVNTIANSASLFSPQSNEFSAIKFGSDNGEIFGVKEYSDGDSLKSIHWKLSSRLGTLMIRQGSLPVENTVAVIFDTYCEKALPPLAIDCVAQFMLSVCQSLCDAKICYCIYFGSKDDEAKSLEITCENDLHSAVGEILSCTFCDKHRTDFSCCVGGDIHCVRICADEKCGDANENIRTYCYGESTTAIGFDENNIDLVLEEFSING